MLARLGLFYAKRLGNRVHSFIFTFLWSCLTRFFFFILLAHSSIEPIDETGTTSPGQSGPGSNDNEGVLHISHISRAGASSPAMYSTFCRSSESDPQHRIQFNVIPKNPPSLGGRRLTPYTKNIVYVF